MEQLTMNKYDLLMDVKPYGNKYDREIDLKDIAKMIRMELKPLIKLGFKFSVRMRDYSAIYIRVKELPKDFELYNPYYDQDLAWKIRNTSGIGFETGKDPRPLYTDEGLILGKYLRAVGNQWNFDKSDIQTDYFHNNYFLFIIGPNGSSI